MKHYLALISVAACLVNIAQADWTQPRPLWNQGMLSGTQHFHAAGDGRVLDLDVDYAVFAPGTFAGSLTTCFAPGFDRAADFVYAYQIYVNEPPSGTQLSELQIGLPEQPGNPVRGLGYDDGFDGSKDDIRPSFAYVLPDSVSFLFEAPQLQPGEFGVTLLFDSPLAPTFFAATVYDSGLSDQQYLPSPASVPTPGAALLGTLGLAAVGVVRRRIG